MKDSNKYLYYSYLLLIGVVFYVMNVFSPLFSDDWHFKFVYFSQTEVKTMSDLLYSLYLHYLYFTWRVTPHFFVILFDGILGKALFNLFNAVVLVWFLHLLATTVSGNKNTRYVYLSFSTFLLFIVINGFSNEFLWMSGACNYLWCGTILLLFARLFHKEITSWYYYPLFFVAGLLAGWTNESLVLSMAVGYLVYIWDHKDKISRSQIFMLIGFFIGLSFMVFSPSAYQRFEANHQTEVSLSDNISSLYQALLYMGGLRILPILILFIGILYFVKKTETMKIIKANKYLIISLVISFLFVLATKEYTYRARFCVEFFSLLLILQLLATVKVSPKLLHLLNIGVLIICCYSLTYLSKNYSDFKNGIAQIEQGKDVILINEPKVPSLFRRFVVYYNKSEVEPAYDIYMKNSLNNMLISNYYGVESLVFIPERLYKEIKENPGQYNRFSSYPDLPFYVKKHDGKRVRRVSYVLDKVNVEDLPFYKRPFVRNNPKYGATKLSTSLFAVITIDNDSYLITFKDSIFDEDRIKDIVVE